MSKKQTKISISYFYTKVKSNNFAKNNIELLKRRGGEMADTPALEAGGSNPVEVQVLSPAKVRNEQFK